MEEKKIKILEICHAGSNSIMGGMGYEMGFDNVSKFNEFKWVILSNFESFGMLEDECKEIKLKDYIIADRRTMVISGKWTK